MIRPVKPKNLNPKGKYIKVTDNNFFANPKWRSAIETLTIWGKPVQFQSGIDMRIFNEEQGLALQELKIYKRIYTAWDNPKDDLIPQLKLLTKYIKPYRITCYVLIGYWSTQEEDLYRVEQLRDLGMDPFAMPYDRKDPYQKKFARWVNRKAIFKTVKWEDYKKKLGE